MQTAGGLAGRPALGVVLEVASGLATVRLFLPDGGAVEVTLPAIGANLLASGATVVALFVGDDPTSGVVVGAIEGGVLAALAAHSHDERYYTESESDGLLAAKAGVNHGHADLVAWAHFDQAVKDLVGDYVVPSPTVAWDVTPGGLAATVTGVRSVTAAQRDALAAADGMMVYNSTSGKLEGRAAGVWVALH